MKGKKLQTEERHKGLQHQCNSRGQQRGAEPGTNHRCVTTASAERKGLTCGRVSQEHMHCRAGDQRSPCRPTQRDSTPHAAGQHAAHVSETGASGACARLPAAPGSVRDAPVLPASTGDQSGAAVRAAQHWARRLHPLVQLQPPPGVCQLPPKLGLQRWGQEH